MGSRYASETAVSSEKSRAEIESTLRRYGASTFGYMAGPERAVIAFEAQGRRIRFELPMPNPGERRFTHTPNTDKQRTREAAYEAWEQGCRQAWRALALCIKAKLEAVEAGITTFEAEFLAHIVLPDGQTVGQLALPSVAAAYRGEPMPPLLGRF